MVKRGDRVLFSISIVILLILSLVLVKGDIFQDLNSSNFNNGTYSGTFYNLSGFIQLNSSRLNGTYTSRIFNGNGIVRWDNITKEISTPYIDYLFAVDGVADIWNSIDSLSWTKINDDYNNGNANGATDIARNSSGSLFILDTQDLWASSNDGWNWTLINDDVNGAGDSNSGLVIAIDSNNYIYIVDGSEDVLKSTNSGVNFTKVNNTDFNGANGAVKGISINSSDVIFVVDAQASVWKSINSGISWTKTNDDYNGANGNTGTADMFVNSSNALFILNTQDLWQSIDSGTTWTLTNDDFNGAGDSNAGVVLTVDSNNYIYIVDGSEDVYKSTNSGINFSRVAVNFNGASGAVFGLVSLRKNSNLSFQVKNCSSSDCSDGIWQNPNLSNINLTSRYFQYMINFTSQDTNITPKLYNLSIGYAILDNTPPLITIVSPMSMNYTFQTIEFNVSLNEEGSSCLYSLDNWQTNHTMTKFNNTYFYYSNLVSDGFYTLRFSCRDNFGNINNTVSRNFAIDSTYPVITITSPQNGGSYGDNNSINLNFSAHDSNGISHCWYSLDNGANISLSNCTNTSFSVSGNGNYLLSVYANDSFRLVSNSSSNFTVQVGAPSIILNSPFDVYLNNSNIEFTYTPTDIDLATCELWGDFTGLFNLNQTNTNPVNNSINSFYLNLNDGNYLWNIRCSDSQGHSAFNGNKSFFIDTIKPVLSISEPFGKKTIRTNIPFIFSVTDTNKDSCWYNVYRGSNLEIQNTTISCNNQTSFNVTLDADFTINFYANDSAGNTNFTSSSFSIDTSTPIINPPSGGSGGGGGGGGDFVNSTLNKLNLEITPIETIMYPGEEKSLELSVKNKATQSVNKCRIKSLEAQDSWISTTDIKNIATGEIVEFLFKLTLPENAEPKLFIECLEGNKPVPLKVILVKSSLDVKILEITLEKNNQILIKYDAGSDSNLLTDLIFSVYSNKEKIKEQVQEINLIKGQRINQEIIIELKDIPPGLLKIAVTKQGEEKSLTEESIMYGSKITGFAINNLMKNSSIIYIVGIIIIFLILTGLIVKKMIVKKGNKKASILISY